MDAWESGGEFEGGPATDERVLAYWRERLNGISPKDPLHDQYSNTVLHLEYAIAESKNSLLYAQGKISDEQRAQFFLDWAKKIPEDSEFYRILQRNAAQFVQRVKATSSARASRSSQAAQAASGQKTYNDYEAAGQFLTNVLTAVAKGLRIIQTDKTLINDLQLASAPGGLSDTERIRQVIDQINEQPWSFLPNVFDENGQRVTGQQIVDLLRKYDPAFSGQLTSDYYAQLLRRQVSGLMIRYQNATTKTEQNQIRNLIEDTTEAARQAAVWDTSEQYMTARREWESIAGSSSATPDEIHAAWIKYQQKLTGLISDRNNPVDDITASAIVGEINLDPSVQTLSEAFTGAEAGAAKENSKTQAGLSFIEGQREAVASGDAVWAFGAVTVADGRPVGAEIRAGGSRIVAVSVREAQAAGAQVGYLPQIGGDPIPVYVTPVPVLAVAQGPLGNEVKSAVVAQIGGQEVAATGNSTLNIKVYDYFYGGQRVRVYAYDDGTGTIRYSTKRPWPDEVTETVDPKTGIVRLDVTALIQAQISAGPEAKGSSIIWRTKTVDGKQVSEVIGFDSKIVFDQIRQIAGTMDPVSFGTLTIKIISQIDAPAVASLVGNEAVKTQIRQDAWRMATDASVQVSSPFAVDPTAPTLLSDPVARYTEIVGQYNRVVESTYGVANDAVRPGQVRSPRLDAPSFGIIPVGSPAPTPSLVALANERLRSVFGVTSIQAPEVPDIRIPTAIATPDLSSTIGGTAPFVAPLPQGVSPIAPSLSAEQQTNIDAYTSYVDQVDANQTQQSNVAAYTSYIDQVDANVPQLLPAYGTQDYMQDPNYWLGLGY